MNEEGFVCRLEDKPEVEGVIDEVKGWNRNPFTEIRMLLVEADKLWFEQTFGESTEERTRKILFKLHKVRGRIEVLVKEIEMYTGLWRVNN